jgi:dTDP-4-dehydrorhamnose reductase
MTRVLILGGSGMLGSAVIREFEGFEGEVLVSTRTQKLDSLPEDMKHVQFDASRDDLDKALGDLGKIDFVVNCIGIIKPHINDADDKQRLNAIQINSLFPQQLSDWAAKGGAKIIQIATDCVFSGATGGYVETDAHDALDVYGKSKSLGEVPNDSMMHLRVSIIGPEKGRSTSLLEWVRNQPKDAKIFGFTDHLWNGVTTSHFGKIARGIIEHKKFRPGVAHLVPGDKLSKDKLVAEIAGVFDRGDIVVEPKASGAKVDRTLDTSDKDFNKSLWKAAGYNNPPTVAQMIREIKP